MDFSTRSSAFGPAVSSGLRDNQRAPSARPESGLALRFPDEGESARLSGRLLSRSDLCKGSGTTPGPWDPQTRRPAQEATAPCAASSHPAGFWSLPAPSLAGGRGFRAPLRSRWEVLTEAPRVLAASSPRENVRIVTITKTHRLRQALLLIKPRLLLQLQRLASRNSWDRRAGRTARSWGLQKGGAPRAGGGRSVRAPRSQPGRFAQTRSTRGLEPPHPHRRDHAVPDPPGPGPQPLHHAPCQPSEQKTGRRASRSSLAAPSLPPCRPVSQTRRLAAPAGNGSSDRNRRPGEQPRLLPGHVQEGVTGADAVFTVMTSGTPLGAPRCTRSGRHHAHSCQSADGGRPLANSKAQSPR